LADSVTARRGRRDNPFSVDDPLIDIDNIVKQVRYTGWNETRKATAPFAKSCARSSKSSGYPSRERSSITPTRTSGRITDLPDDEAVAISKQVRQGLLVQFEITTEQHHHLLAFEEDAAELGGKDVSISQGRILGPHGTSYSRVVKAVLTSRVWAQQPIRGLRLAWSSTRMSRYDRPISAGLDCWLVSPTRFFVLRSLTT
jgi:hypothetical protein